jgi:hypothetical protein
MAFKSRLKIGIGQRTPVTGWASEPGFIAQMNKATKTLEQSLHQIFAEFDEVTTDVILDAMQPTFEKAKIYVPKKEGKLLASAYLEAEKYRQHRGTGMRVAIGFARDGDPPYALYVHEMVELQHAAPTRAKYLEAAVMEDLTDIRDRIARNYKQFAGM